MLVALALVAIASRGSVGSGEAGARRASDTLTDLVFTLYVVLLALGALVFLGLLLLRRHARATSGLEPRRNPLVTLAALSVLVGAFYLLAQQSDLREAALRLRELRPPAGDSGIEEEAARRGGAREADFAWIPVLVTAALASAGLLAWWYAGKARRKAREPRQAQSLAEELADVLAETLDGLRAEPDPRRAVIAAYARLERVAAASGLPRRPADAPLEYLGRLLGTLDVSSAAVSRLTTLFERAKFSQHEVDERMKQQAIAALESVQEDLRQAELRAVQERQEALRELTERARQRVGA